ncbi:MAG: alpha/beta hydrolase [Sulfuritalea sp.]|nr:alpha/beta hydrolase [Sulfuritalea sp.]MDP1983385.1 alpha/beta hydrolase [Sulfuritalea sp.]
MLIKLVRQTLKLVPDSVGFTITAKLAAMTQRPSLDERERQAMVRAEKFRFGDGRANIAWAWGTGPLVVLVHGWSGRAAQMAPLAARIAEGGFRAVAPDVTGHGDSPGKHAHWRHFIEDIPALARTLNEDVYAYVGHSAGALTMMAARHAGNISASRYVCICAPSHPFPPIGVIQKKLAPRPGIVARYKAFIAEQFGSTWDALLPGLVYQGLGANTLLFYDKTDRFVDHSEGDKLAAIAAGARLIKTDRYSHTTILAAPELHAAVCGFLRHERESGHRCA